MSNWLGIETTNPLVPSQETLDQLCANQLRLLKADTMGSPSYSGRIDRLTECMDRVSDRYASDHYGNQQFIDRSVLTGTVAIPLIIALIFRKQILRAFENAVVDTGAAAVRSKRSASGYLGGLKAKMDAKANTERQD
ncbi:hypothetical protein ELH93_34340 [Rhizobium leguminosarum]|uniref:hypothetical protein n=1 Tax=Rhizobium leguminosarum TaxID=384 RepID=UPI00103275EC|nr:hypothetical protein [Rhizobium leguminosarum]TAY25177.1 hypothetical protein ELH93_34340 [Rhizobium leguminosarum]